MTAPELELWAVCNTCDRSFFVSSDAESSAQDVTCPVCAEAPTRLEQRNGDTVVAVQTLAPDPAL